MIDDDILIVKPSDLAMAYPEHVLQVNAEGKADPEFPIPDKIYMRYEPDRELLYIDTMFITAAGLDETLSVWKKSQQYCGPMSRRMATGTGRIEEPKNVAVFDLSENPRDRVEPIKRGRGRPLTIEKIRAREAQAAKVAETMIDIRRTMNSLRTHYGDHLWFDEVERIYALSRGMLEDAHKMLSKGRALTNKRTAVAKPKKMPVSERIHLEAIDAFMTDYAYAVHRTLKRYNLRDGKPELQQKVIRPKINPEDWVGRYEEDVQSDGTGQVRQLFIPVAVLKSMKELHDYKKDYRYSRKAHKLVGDRTKYCAVFNLLRTFRSNEEYSEEKTVLDNTEN
jgi:hypothetical protein